MIHNIFRVEVIFKHEHITLKGDFNNDSFTGRFIAAKCL